MTDYRFPEPPTPIVPFQLNALSIASFQRLARDVSVHAT